MCVWSTLPFNFNFISHVLKPFKEKRTSFFAFIFVSHLFEIFIITSLVQITNWIFMFSHLALAHNTYLRIIIFYLDCTNLKNVVFISCWQWVNWRRQYHKLTLYPSVSFMKCNWSVNIILMKMESGTKSFRIFLSQNVKGNGKLVIAIVSRRF